jgi:hypothetical protein
MGPSSLLRDECNVADINVGATLERVERGEPLTLTIRRIKLQRYGGTRIGRFIPRDSAIDGDKCLSEMPQPAQWGNLQLFRIKRIINNRNLGNNTCRDLFDRRGVHGDSTRSGDRAGDTPDSAASSVRSENAYERAPCCLARRVHGPFAIHWSRQHRLRRWRRRGWHIHAISNTHRDELGCRYAYGAMSES